MSALREAFLDELKDLLDAERQLLKALPKMAKAAMHPGLRVAFEEHQEQTAEQIRRLGRVFAAFEETPQGKKCKGMEGLIEEGEEKIEEDAGDAALIGAAQKAEHYEIAAYGTLTSWAVALGHDEVIEILNENLKEEKATDKRLTVIAQTVVNSQDSQRDSEEMGNGMSKRRQPKAQTTKRAQSRSGSKGGRTQAKGRTVKAGSKTRSKAKARGSSSSAKSMRGSKRGRTTKSQGSRAPRSKRMRAKS